MSKAQNMNIVWRYSRAIFDPNRWQEISESRVDWFFKVPFGNNLHSLDDADSTVVIAGLRPQRWQMLPVDGVAGRYAMRSNYTGAQLQLGTCYKPAEAADSKTGICLVQASGEDSQKWDVDFVETTGSTYIFRNVANSSDFVLDCHPGNPIFMNKNFDPANAVAQHWIVRPDGGEINDEAFSTTFTNLPPGATNKPLPTDLGSVDTDAPRGTTRGDGSPAATSGPGPGSSSGSNTETAADGSPLSAGAVAGIGIGAALGVLLLAGVIFAYFWRRRQTPHPPVFAHKSNVPEMDDSSRGQPGTAAMPSAQATQRWHAKGPQSDSSVAGGGMPPPTFYSSSNNNEPASNYPDGHQPWQGVTDPMSAERRPSNGQVAPVEAMSTGVSRQELDSTPVAGNQNRSQGGYSRHL